MSLLYVDKETALHQREAGSALGDRTVKDWSVESAHRRPMIIMAQ